MSLSLSRRVPVLLVALVALSMSGCRGGAAGPLIRAASAYVTRLLVGLGIISEGTLIHIGLIAIGVCVLLLTLPMAEAYYDEVRRSAPAWRQAGWGRCWGGVLFIVLGSLVCGGLILGGSVPERSHWVGGGLIALIGVGCVTFALEEPAWVYRLPLSVVAAAAFAGSGWWLSIPPTDEETADKRLCRRGLDTLWEQAGDDSHVVAVWFETPDTLKRDDIDAVLTDLGRLPHLKRVHFSFPAEGVPDGVVERIAAALPRVQVLPPIGYRVRPPQN